MSNELFCPDVEKYVNVLVRTFSDEPVLLTATGGNDSTVNVFGQDEDKGLPYPAGLVYEYDQSLYKELQAAYNSGDQPRLTRIWKQAKHFELHS